MSGTGGRSRSPEEGSRYRNLRGAFLTGVSIVVPVLVTVYVLSIAAEFLFGALSPVVDIMANLGIGGEEGVILTRLIAILLLLLAILVTGLVTRFRFGEQAVNYFDGFVEAIPGVGAVYTSFRQMGDVLVESDSQNFQEVYLVEFPYDDSYVIGFQTAETHDEIKESAGEKNMMSLFLPLAPNPMMGGFLAHIPKERVLEVDMTVEEGVRSVATLGIATESRDEDIGFDDPPTDLREAVDEYVDMPSATEDEDDGEV